MFKRITKAFVGQSITFHGYDGKDYSAYVVKVSRGVATVVYAVQPLPEIVTAYTSDGNRIELKK